MFTRIKLYTSMKRQPTLNKLILQDVFQLSLHAVYANSQRTVFRINMPPSFLLWRIELTVVDSEKFGTLCVILICKLFVLATA